MNIGYQVTEAVNRAPMFTRLDRGVAKRRGFSIHAYVGPNGSGKSLMAALDTLPTLRGLLWACDNIDHVHTAEGVTSGVRRVLSTMRFTTPTGADHPLWTPLTDFSQIISAEHVDLILDEVGGAVASSTSDDIPLGVKASLQELRRREVVCRWTAPSWARASKVLRETSQAVTLLTGRMPVAHRDGVSFPGSHQYTDLSLDGESLREVECVIPDEHLHDSGRLWGARRLMLARTYDASVFEEWTVGKRQKQRPECRTLFWRPGSDAERAYDTHAYVEKLAQVTASGTCDHCGGTRSRPRCTCEPSVSRRRRVAALPNPTTERPELGPSGPGSL